MEFSRENILRESTFWWKCKFELVNDNNYPVIRPIPGTKVETYEPLNIGERPGKQLLTPNEGHDWAPHIHLARVNTVDDILSFVNKWGLLGLRSIERFSHTYLPDRGTTKILLGKEYSKWYEWEYPEGIKPQYPTFFSQQEPVNMILDAVEEYHTWLNNLEFGQGNNQFGSYLLSGCLPVIVFNKKRWILDWQINSLFEAIHLRTALDLAEGSYGFRKCKWPRCGKYFIAEHDNDKFCSYRCQNNYFATESKLKRKQLQG